MSTPTEDKRTRDLPERADYKDTGCFLHPKCLTCPLPVCQYDMPGGVAGLLRGQRDEQIMALWKLGVQGHEIASLMGVSLSTVDRIKRLSR